MDTSEEEKVKQAAELGTYDELHEEGYSYLADNVYIHSGYRVNYSITECIKSVFQLHNETFNVWTHMIGSIIFMLLFLGVVFDQYQMYGITRNVPICDLHEVPFIMNGRHTVRMFVAKSLSKYERSICSPIHRASNRGYYIASMLFDHSLNRIPSLITLNSALISSQLHSRAEEAAEYIATVGFQIDAIKEEIILLQSRLALVRQSGTEWLTQPARNKIVLMKHQLQYRIDEFSKYIDVSRHQSHSDKSVQQYIIDEYASFVTSVHSGLQMLSGLDPSETLIHHVPQWPIVVFIISAMICLLSSAIFHLMFVYSKSLYFFLSRLDYAGIAVLIAGSFFPMIYYSFYCHPYLLTGYLIAITVMSILTFGMSLSPSFGAAKYIVLRTAIFTALGGFGIIPILHLIWKYGIFDHHVTIMLQPLIIMAALYITGAIIYSTRFPERFYPGRFDVFFSSHQLWHICVVLAALVHYMNAIQHYEWRWVTECSDLP